MAQQDTATKSTAPQLLRQQHENVKRMFSEMSRVRGKDRDDLFDCLRKTLAVHETAEEMIVYPEVRQIDNDVVEARLSEESEAKKVLAQLEKLTPSDSKFDSMFDEFRAAVLQHATAEENEVFPLLEQNVPGARLLEMADAILLAERVAPTHPHPHGPETALGNLMVGPFVAMVDKVRDKIAEHHKKS